MTTERYSFNIRSLLRNLFEKISNNKKKFTKNNISYVKEMPSTKFIRAIEKFFVFIYAY